MERIPEEQNFHEISENRKELRKAISELGGKGAIFEEHYEKPLAEANEQASKFKVADFGGLKGAKEALKKQKAKHEKEVLADRAHIDYEQILKVTPELDEVQKVMEKISDLEDFRMRRMFELLSPETSLSTMKRNKRVLESICEEIKSGKEKLSQVDPLVRRQAELIEYKENLEASGHICITPSTEEDLIFIGEKMLSGQPMLLYGPTGTGKTSLAKYASEHFTGKRAWVVACSNQTKESNIYGKTGFRPSGDFGAMETFVDYGPLIKAAQEGCPVIFDEFNTLDPGLLVVLKNVFATRIGETLDVPGNGTVIVQPGFQTIFTANLKSEKNPERQDITPEILREFDVNSRKVKYTPSSEAYDIILSRLLNRDGSLDMSFYDLNTTLPNLCKVMTEIQESYTNETDKKVAERSGAINRTTGKFHSLKKFVMTQGTIQKIISLWSVLKQIGEDGKSFSEFLDQNFKSMLTLEGYPEDDRVLVAKILASKGFLLTLDPKELDLPEDIFKLNTIKAMRGKKAVAKLREESGAVKHLTLKEVAELDPFGKRAEMLKNQAEALLGDENVEKGDDFSRNLEKKIGKLFGKEKKNQASEISTEYTRPDGKKETITLDFEVKLAGFISFYQKTNIDLPSDFEDTIRELWDRNQADIEKAIEQNGFDDILIIPENIPPADLAEKMKMGNGYSESPNFREGGSFAGAVNQNADKSRIILYHKKTLPEIQTENGLDVHLGITAGESLKLFQQKPDEHMTLTDFMIMERKIFEETGKHISDYTKKSAQWLNTKSFARLVHSYWNPDRDRLCVVAGVLGRQGGFLGVRPSRCFF